MSRHPGSAEDRALRYLTEVYGSGLPSFWMNRFFLGLGVVGCVSAMLILGHALYALYLSPGASTDSQLPLALPITMVIGLFAPLLVVFLENWRKPLTGRRTSAINRIFGTIDLAVEVSDTLRQKYPEASDIPSPWAFPIRPDYAVFSSEKSFFTAYGLFAASSLYVAHSVPRFLDTVIFLFSLYFVPVILSGMFAAFGSWGSNKAVLMAYPVSVFLRDVRILQNEDRWRLQ
ncbi:hypothetical protein AB4090_09920 [Acidithiobacillus sp. IBUN Pt1247-S3]|uniref:hypothetical protein n=1 Tax=Acidithiobacillus sp. IBUN Pt1247-S3 TaxID=3166642 RepID=UPI0034E5B70E